MRVTKTKQLWLVLAAVTAACSPEKSKTAGDTTGAAAPSASTGAAGGAALTGAGSTFAYPIYSRWAADYASKTGVKINYQGIGSGGGIRQFSEMTVDFGATDGPMTDAQMAKAKGGPVLHIPTVLGSVVLTYNLPEIKNPLRFTGPLLADIFMGKITRWNDRRIAALNPGVTLPAQDILVVHRSDGSGTTYIFTDFLSRLSPAWAKGPGKGTDINWPVGIGGKGSDGVSGQVKQTPGAIGYVELAYANQNKLPAALIQNAAGKFIAASIASTTAAAAGVAGSLPDTTDYRISIVNAPGADAYPIASFTWILIYQNQKDPVKGQKLIDFLKWALTEGEKSAPSLEYAPLPQTMVTQLLARLGTVKIGGQ